MNKADFSRMLTEYLKEHLKVEVALNHNRGFYEYEGNSLDVTVRVKLNDEIIDEYNDSCWL